MILVAIISPNADMQAILQRILRRRGIETLAVTSCHEAHACLRNGAPVQAIVIDVAGCSAGETKLCPARRTDLSIAGIPVIAVTSRARNPDGDPCGSLACIRHPEEFRELPDFILQVISVSSPVIRVAATA